MNNAAAAIGGNFSDNININLFIQGDPGAGVLGQSQASYFNYTWAQITAGLQSDRKSADDFTATGAGGSTVNGSADPVSGAHSWWTTRAEAKALGLIPDDLVNDGIVTFGGLYTYDYNAADGIDSGAIDFQGVALHRISEVMGRVGLSGGNVNLSAGGTAANTYSLIDAFSYAGLNARGLTTGPVQQFSIDDGASLIRVFNGQAGSSRDWAGGNNDAFNTSFLSGVVNPMSAVDLRLLDVLGYDLVVTGVPEPSTVLLLIFGLIAGWAIRRRVEPKR